VTHPFLDGPRPRALAHRGWHLDDLAGMENSLSAFTRAAAEGYRYIETDVHATADGVVIVHHDPSLDRTTDRTGVITELPFAEVSKAKVGGREPVCSLDVALEELPETLFNIDVKADSAVEPVLRTVRRHDAWDRVCLASFADDRLARLRKRGGERLLTSAGQRSARLLWLSSRLPVLPLRRLIGGAAAQVPPRHKGLEVVDSRFVDRAHRWGLEVHAWTVDDSAEMTRLLDLGVDGLVTDRPDVLREVLRDRSADPAAG
jgi:glycerophosphoryl diester phosphodiesterase